MRSESRVPYSDFRDLRLSHLGIKPFGIKPFSWDNPKRCARFYLLYLLHLVIVLEWSNKRLVGVYGLVLSAAHISEPPDPRWLFCALAPPRPPLVRLRSGPPRPLLVRLCSGPPRPPLARLCSGPMTVCFSESQKLN